MKRFAHHLLHGLAVAAQLANVVAQASHVIPSPYSAAIAVGVAVGQWIVARRQAKKARSER